MDFLASLAGSFVAIWFLTRIIYLFTSKMDKKPQVGLAFVIGILFITGLTSIGWFMIEDAISYYVALLLWFILDFTGVTNKRIIGFTDISDNPETKHKASSL